MRKMVILEKMKKIKKMLIDSSKYFTSPLSQLSCKPFTVSVKAQTVLNKTLKLQIP